METILFLDLEVHPTTQKVEAVGAILGHNRIAENLNDVVALAAEARYICGHNLLGHDLETLRKYPQAAALLELPVIDTLHLSPLLRPDRIRHHLAKDYHQSTPWKNDPLADARLCRELLGDLLGLFRALPSQKQAIFRALLEDRVPFQGFFRGLDNGAGTAAPSELPELILQVYGDAICRHCPLAKIIDNAPAELAYALALIDTGYPGIFTPSWLIFQYPWVQPVFDSARAKDCGKSDCTHCRNKLDPAVNLRRYFGYESFRSFEGDGAIPLQEQAVRAALKNDSFLVIFPTGGGKSLTFQLPALIRGEVAGALTVVVSPLVALMKDQVDVLARKGIVNAVAINSLLSPLERGDAIEKVADGTVSIVYLSPESLRSNTVLRLLTGRRIDRFVIDEAHCFSAWGQDFRVDYLYIGKFIRLLEERKMDNRRIPISCFTATARPEVIEDIRGYFKDKNERELKLFQTHQKRTNLSYRALIAKEDTDKLFKLVNLLEEVTGPAIVYVSRVKTTQQVSEALRKHGINSAPYNGKMHSRAKREVQDAFQSGQIDVIVATSAFGMGVDKDNVEMVVHYEISNSLENYIQEAGRAGRDPKMRARCVILYDEEDLNKHFALLQGSRLNKKEVAQIWQGIKWFKRERISKSALEIAKAAGWDEEMKELQTRVTAAVNALEEAGYLRREQNSPRIFASGLIPKSLMQAMEKVAKNRDKFTHGQHEKVGRILQYIYGKQEVRVDYMSDRLGISKSETGAILNLLKEIEVLSDFQDLTASLNLSRGRENSKDTFSNHAQLEKALFEWLQGDTGRLSLRVDLREANDAMEGMGIPCSISKIRNLIRYWEWKRYIKKERTQALEWNYRIDFRFDPEQMEKQIAQRLERAVFVMDYLIALAEESPSGEAKEKLVEFSVFSLKQRLEFSTMIEPAPLSEYEQILLYFHTIQALDLRNGLLVYYNRITIVRLVDDNRIQYKDEDYRQLEKHYQKKTEQIHIVGNYAELLLKRHLEAIRFADDYFRMDYEAFLRKYFPAREKRSAITRTLTEKKFHEIFGNLSSEQMAAVKDGRNEQVLVLAGPGSGKTRVLVHKMASLLLMEDIKPQQFLMLAFSRPAVQEFRLRLQRLAPGLASHVDIFTYHGFAFRLLGRMGSIDQSADILQLATDAIRNRQIPLEKVTAKSVVMLDEFQDISETEFGFLQAILDEANNIRVFAAGDDDQAIYGFRGASVTYMKELIDRPKSAQYFLTRNYRAKANLVDFSNEFLLQIPASSRLKSGMQLMAHQSDLGTIRVHIYHRGYMVEPLCKAILKREHEGTTAVLTATNEEALQGTTLLRQMGIPALLIASRPGFSLHNLHEIQSFTRLLLPLAEKELGFIAKEDWESSVKDVESRFADSKNLDFFRRIVKGFDQQYDRKYKTDWLEYLWSLRMEDFYFHNESDRELVMVSTMHKAKGKEFDNVFLLLDGFDIHEDERKRVVYVAITRAKRYLEIHTNQPYFDGISVRGSTVFMQEGMAEPPAKVVLQCGLTDVNLKFFKGPHVAKTMQTITAGEELLFRTDPFVQLSTESGRKAAFLSKKMADRLDKYFQTGYRIESCKADMLVWWKGKDMEEEVLVLLPEITLVRHHV